MCHQALGKKAPRADHRTFKRVSGRSPRLNVTNGPEGPLVTADVLPGVILPGSVGSIGICAPLGPAVPALTVGPVGTKYRKNMQTISVPSVPYPAGTVPIVSSESLEAQNGARAPSKKLGEKERQYSVAEIRQMMHAAQTDWASQIRATCGRAGRHTDSYDRVEEVLRRGL